MRSLRAQAGYRATAAPVRLTCDGQAIEALAGESLAAALVAAGVARFRTTGASAQRGIFCGMGVCRECLACVNGRSGVRACLTTAMAGMQVQTSATANAPADCSWQDALAAEQLAPDVLVIGGGPAGLAAAKAAAQSGASVILLDERSAPGGQYFKPLASSQAFVRAPDRQFAEGAALVREVRDAGAQVICEASVWSAFAGPEIAASCGGRRMVLRPRKLVLATGAYERGVPFPGWTLPGCMTTGAAQTLLRANRVSPGEKVLVAGHGPLNWQLALELLDAGVEVVALAEAAQSPGLRSIAAVLRMLAADGHRTLEGLRMLLRLSPLLRFGTVVKEAKGLAGVQGATLSGIDARGNPVAGKDERVDANVVCVGYGFLPSNELARTLGCAHRGSVAVRDDMGRSSVPDVFIAGDCAGMGGAAAALAEGELAGLAAAMELGYRPAGADANVARKRAELARHRRFQRALWQLFDAPLLTTQLAQADTLVCRCEEVTLAEVQSARSDADIGASEIKKHTRAGMGRCQGRYCGDVLASLCGDTGELAPFAPRPPARPVRIGDIARDQLETAS
jgi:NADPH-dependent 2,4-dienoyl-CoA reductase/sulfur reductase-like enzyme